MAVINPTHRQAILHKCQAETGIDVDFDSLLGDLSSAIQDLESIAAVSAYVPDVLAFVVNRKGQCIKSILVAMLVMRGTASLLDGLVWLNMYYIHVSVCMCLSLDKEEEVLASLIPQTECE